MRPLLWGCIKHSVPPKSGLLEWTYRHWRNKTMTTVVALLQGNEKSLIRTVATLFQNMGHNPPCESSGDMWARGRCKRDRIFTSPSPWSHQLLIYYCKLVKKRANKIKKRPGERIHCKGSEPICESSRQLACHRSSNLTMYWCSLMSLQRSTLHQ